MQESKKLSRLWHTGYIQAVAPLPDKLSRLNFALVKCRASGRSKTIAPRTPSCPLGNRHQIVGIGCNFQGKCFHSVQRSNPKNDPPRSLVGASYERE